MSINYIPPKPSGSSPPTSIPAAPELAQLAATQTQEEQILGLSTSALITSNTLTEVLNVTGPGVIRIIMGKTTVEAGSANRKFKVTIDGNVVTDFDANWTSGRDGVFSVGRYEYDTTGDLSFMAFDNLPFNSQLLVECAGDGTNNMYAAYSYYLV